MNPPPDLANPVPYKGHTWPALQQKPDEFEWLIKLLLEAKITSILTIGAYHGGVEWHLAREFREAGRDLNFTIIEKEPAEELRRSVVDIVAHFRQFVLLVARDSTSPSLTKRLYNQYDAVFIDGDHSYQGARSDFNLALSLGPRIIALHDIVESEFCTATGCEVSRLWAEIKCFYRTEERSSGEWGGIGVVRL